jgi:2-(1,2-epoxy-1,2-dihydrophenyl)acetyl-CoA isomerase
MAGGDVAVFHQHLAELPELIVTWGREMHAAFLALRRMGKPVLASVHGAVAGAGFSLMCAADLAVAAADTRFTLAYANIGASPDGGSTYFLPRLVGYKRAMEMIMLPDRFDAETARQNGLVNWVVPNDKLAEETARIAQRLAAGPTRAFAEAKRLVNQSLDLLGAQMEQELQAFSRCARGGDLKEGVTAFMEKRKPVFKGA